MAELTNAQIDAALERGTITRLHEPRASSARYDRQLGRVVVELTNGCTFAFPPRLAQGLENATEDQLAEIEILGAGYGLHWEALDADLSMPSLLNGFFGTRSFMAQHAGRSTSVAKAAAARINGAKGGRPRNTEAVGANLSANAFLDQEIVMTETDEEAVVAKSVHVVEEVVIHKAVEEHVETIRDTLRREEVQISDPTKQPVTGNAHRRRS